MRHINRSLTALAAAAVLLSAPMAHADTGKSDPVARQQRQLTHAIEKLSDRLDDAVKPSRIDRLSVATQNALKANVATDQTELATLASTVSGATATFDFRAAGDTIRANQPENYRRAENVLRKAQRLLTTAPAGSAAATALTAVVSEGRTVNDDTDKAALRDLHKHLQAAKDLLAPSDDD